MKALLLENIDPRAAALLAERGMDVVTRAGALDEDELIDALCDVDLIGIRSKTRISERVLSRAPSLRAIGAFCIGTDQIELDAAARRGIVTFNAPFSGTRSVVELAIAEIIALARRLTEKNLALHSGTWSKDATGSHEIRGRTLGIVGYGNIGSQLSVLAEMLGLRVFYYDIEDRLALGNAQRCHSLEDLLAVSEVVSLHVDGRAGNAGLFDSALFSRMRPRSLFLNLSRGFTVDIEALREHLNSGHLAGAALDVYPQEPKKKGDTFTSRLQGVPNVILTPHIGGSTEEAQSHIGNFVASKLMDFVDTGDTSLNANLPALKPPGVSAGSRILHFHSNEPGALAKINTILAEHRLNVEAQSLSTRGSIGYAITDLDQAPPAPVLDALRSMTGTIRLLTTEGGRLPKGHTTEVGATGIEPVTARV